MRKITKKLKGTDSNTTKITPPIIKTLEVFKTKTGPWNEIKDTWIETFTERSTVIDNLQICSSEYLKDFVCLGLPNGYELAKVDALARYPNMKTIATSNWDTISEKIIAKAKDVNSHSHHNSVLELLYQTFSSCTDSRKLFLAAKLYCNEIGLSRS